MILLLHTVNEYFRDDGSKADNARYWAAGAIPQLFFAVSRQYRNERKRKEWETYEQC